MYVDMLQASAIKTDEQNANYMSNLNEMCM